MADRQRCPAGTGGRVFYTLPLLIRSPKLPDVLGSGWVFEEEDRLLKTTAHRLIAQYGRRGSIEHAAERYDMARMIKDEDSAEIWHEILQEIRSFSTSIDELS